MNVMMWLEIELAHYDFDVQRISHCATWIIQLVLYKDTW